MLDGFTSNCKRSELSTASEANYPLQAKRTNYLINCANLICVNLQNLWIDKLPVLQTSSLQELYSTQFNQF